MHIIYVEIVKPVSVEFFAGSRFDTGRDGGLVVVMSRNSKEALYSFHQWKRRCSGLLV